MIRGKFPPHFRTRSIPVVCEFANHRPKSDGLLTARGENRVLKQSSVVPQTQWNQHWALQAAEKLVSAVVLKGHDFSRADKANRMNMALATEGRFLSGFAITLGFFPQPASVVPQTQWNQRWALQAAEKLASEGGGFNPRIKPTESPVALATEGLIPSISRESPSFSGITPFTNP